MKEQNKKQLECELNCRATAALNDSVIDDLFKEDACLSDLLKDGEDNGSEDKPKPIN